VIAEAKVAIAAQRARAAQHRLIVERHLGAFDGRGVPEHAAQRDHASLVEERDELAKVGRERVEGG
jgi:hypothetical protein